MKAATNSGARKQLYCEKYCLSPLSFFQLTPDNYLIQVTADAEFESDKYLIQVEEEIRSNVEPSKDVYRPLQTVSSNIQRRESKPHGLAASMAIRKVVDIRLGGMGIKWTKEGQNRYLITCLQEPIDTVKSGLGPSYKYSRLHLTRLVHVHAMALCSQRKNRLVGVFFSLFVAAKGTMFIPVLFIPSCNSKYLS